MTSPRVLSMDAYRGMTMLLLMPNPYSAFGVKQMAEANPDSGFWQAMSRLFTHVPWTGVSVWDMVMPSFLLLMGASIPFSYSARLAQGDKPAWFFQHAALRACAFVMLGLLLSIRPETLLQEAAPLLFLAALALPLPALAALGSARPERDAGHRLVMLWGCTVLAMGAWQIGASLRNPGIHHAGGVLVQAGLAWFPACLLVRQPRKRQWGAAFTLLAAWWLAFVLYPVPAESAGVVRAAIQPTGERFAGLFAHWNMNTNLASAVDTWFFERLPRNEPFELSYHGYQVSNFVPTIASLVLGMLAGSTIRDAPTPAHARASLLRVGSALLAGGAVAAWTVCPLVKSLWTPSWVLFSSGAAILVLALLHHVCDVRGARRWAAPFAMIGGNSLVLYVLSYYSWRILQPWRAVLGPESLGGRFGPLLESACVAFSLSLLAIVLARRRVHLRI